ncbi:hypothetical protein BKI52_24285 [marine bacterium AO1-C]|nr:hypothetical protein BKI52_24285 [marine bacterium AO1-C]
MDKLLWDKIVAFDFDNPPAEYSFTIRLADENHWTKSFTNQAILEYKKFMYLAATSNGMVSPSKIVDIVWHQHLIFTQSYDEFCKILGKNIQHIPSTHDKKDFRKFQEAASRTKHLYIKNFGEQPKNIWKNDQMMDSLNLRKSKLGLTTFVFLGWVAFLLAIFPLMEVLEPFYVTIQGTTFLEGFLFLAVASFILLELFNHSRLKKIIGKADNQSFLYKLQPSELIYLKTQNPSKLINGYVDQLVSKRAIQIDSDYKMKLKGRKTDGTQEQETIVATLKDLGSTHYPALLQQLAAKPIFLNTTNAMKQLKSHINKTTQFGAVFYLNFIVFWVLAMIGATRIFIGLSREKPVMYIVVLSVITLVASIAYLVRLTRLAMTSTIPKLYRKTVKKNKELKKRWDWNYFLLGDDALDVAFAPVAGYIDKNSSGGSSCGTSCGSSCGGGGCGGGCGGCGG